jgi:hypothetical protein
MNFKKKFKEKKTNLCYNLRTKKINLQQAKKKLRKSVIKVKKDDFDILDQIAKPTKQIDDLKSQRQKIKEEMTLSSKISFLENEIQNSESRKREI